MASFLSGITDKVNDATNQISNVASGNVPQPDTSSQQQPTSPNYGQGMHEARAAYNTFDKTRKTDQEPAEGKVSNTKKIGKFFKSAFGYGNAAMKVEKAGESFTGDSLKDVNPFGNQQRPA